MYLRNLNLINFKNYPEAEFTFDEGVNCLVGANGSGKTNLLDAIHYLSLCKSYFNAVDTQNIRHDEPFFVIQGTFIAPPPRKGENDASPTPPKEGLSVLSDNEDQGELPPLGGGGAEHIYCAFKRGQGKIFKRNQKEYSRLAEHIGLLPVVMITPVDNMLITEGSEERRKLMDSIISQYDRVYLDDLITYNKVLSQRNALLKHFVLHKRFDSASLEIWDEQLIPLAENIYDKRLKFTNDFAPIFRKHYASLSGGKEEVQLEYESQLHKGNFSDVLKAALDRDRALQYTGAGIHKDDLHFLIDGYPVKRFASQGQQKSFLIAIKLAQFDFIREIKKVKPLLLLDDIFDKLDETRMRSLLQMVSHHNFGQIFLTDTHPDRAKEIFDSIYMPVKLFRIESGNKVEA